MTITCYNHSYVLVHALDDMEGGIDAVGFGDGFHKGTVLLMLHFSKILLFLFERIGVWVTT